ncbi:MAG: hypothetical protein AAGH72_09350 [Verrucomicrobiota bacterium]
MWEAVSGSDNLDDNPDPFNNEEILGKRIFPGAENPGGAARDKVKLKITGGLPNAVMHLKAFDVDDPVPAAFDNERKLDENDLANVAPTGVTPGQDNRGSVNGSSAGVFVTTNQPTAQVTLDANGEGEIEFKVTMQPGDNFRVVGQILSDSELGSVQETDASATKYVSADDEPVEGFGSGAASPLLTVWRKLHIENDSMSMPVTKPSPDRQTGTGSNWGTVTSGGGNIRTTLVVSLSESVPTDFYASGKIVSGSQTHNLYAINTHGAGSSITVTFATELTQAERDGFNLSSIEIFDDDDQALPSGWSAALPRMDLINETVKSKFKLCHIDLVEAPASYNNSDVPFELNIPSNLLNPGGYVPNSVKNKATLPDSDEYWAMTVTATYQDIEDDDLDPNGDVGAFGGTDDGLGIAMIYIENQIDDSTIFGTQTPTINESKLLKLLDDVVAHEIGHVPGSKNEAEEHAEGGLMDNQILGGGQTLEFTPLTIDRLRSPDSWRTD